MLLRLSHSNSHTNISNKNHSEAIINHLAHTLVTQDPLYILVPVVIQDLPTPQRLISMIPTKSHSVSNRSHHRLSLHSVRLNMDRKRSTKICQEARISINRVNTSKSTNLAHTTDPNSPQPLYQLSTISNSISPKIQY